MNMKDINVNSMNYKNLSKEEKLKVVKLKINELLKSTDKNKVYMYYDGQRVGIPKNKMGIFKDLCEREKSLEKCVSVTIEEESTDIDMNNKNMEVPVYKAEIVEEKENTSNNGIKDMNLTEVNERIKYIEKYLYEMTNLYKKDEYKSTKIIKMQGYNGEAVYIPYSKQGDYKTLYKYLKLLEMKKRELESVEVKYVNEVSYEYLSEDDNPYETGYMQFASDYNASKIIPTSKVNMPIKEDLSNKEESIMPTDNNIVNDINTNIPTNDECKDLMVIENKKNKEKKAGFGKKILGLLAGTTVIKGICKGTKLIGSKVKAGYNKVKKEVNEVSEILRKNKVKTALCAWLVAAATVVCSFLPKSSSKKSKPDDIVKPTSTIEVTEPTTKEEDNIIIEEPVVEEPTEEIEENKDYSLGDNIAIQNNAYIYTNSYDATDSVNNYIPYYNNSYDREIMGVTYELDGNLYTIYKNEASANDKVNELISKGAKQTAVLVVRSDLVNTGEYEGYYNVNSLVRTKSK